MYDQVKIHWNKDPLQITISRCDTAIESLSIFVENML